LTAKVNINCLSLDRSIIDVLFSYIGRVIRNESIALLCTLVSNHVCVFIVGNAILELIWTKSVFNTMLRYCTFQCIMVNRNNFYRVCDSVCCSHEIEVFFRNPYHVNLSQRTSDTDTARRVDLSQSY